MVAQWKNAATVIVVARNQLTSGLNKTPSRFPQHQYDYNVMLLKRNSKSKFFDKAFVFPGGATTSPDFSPLWLEHFAQNGFSHNKLSLEFVHDKRPPLYENMPNECLPEIGYRITAIRETFEETGVLICKALDKENQGLQLDIREWQKRVYNDPSEFLRMCRQHSLCPDVWSLYDWCNWLTPEHMGPKRFDTIFYMCILNDMPSVLIDEQEITEVRWMDPVASIVEQVRGDIWLPPPQLYELSRMANFVECDHLQRFAAQRQRRGVERWLPIIRPTSSGRLSIYPGDELYPTNDALGIADTEELSFENSGVNQNRMLYYSPTRCKMSVNISDPFGHKQPLNLIDAIASKL